MPKKRKEPLDAVVARAMRETTEDLPEDVNGEQALLAQAHSARTTLSTVVTDMAESLSSACVRLHHRGSVPPREGRPGRPCSRCSTKIRHYQEAAALVAPDRPS